MEKDKMLEKLNDFVVIGTDKLGSSVATSLFALGKEVLAIDINPNQINSLNGKVSTAVTTDATNIEVLKSLGVQNFDCAVVCITDDMESSILASQNCKDLGVGYTISTAMSEQHGRILNALGVDLVLYPDQFVGKKLASLLAKPGITELVELTDQFKIFEMSLPEIWHNKFINEINLRRKYKLSIVFIKRENKVLSPEPEMELLPGDTLVVAGESSKINAIANLINDASDIETQLNNIFGEK